jgi:hypothetical protein
LVPVQLSLPWKREKTARDAVERQMEIEKLMAALNNAAKKLAAFQFSGN